jgi:SAM-dependent methyltransferase
MTEKAEDYYDESYFNAQKEIGKFSGIRLERIFSEFVLPGDKVLDFGCGGGFLIDNLDCLEKKGIEINPIARRHALSLGIQCFERIEEIDDKWADVIISNSCLEHVRNPLIALQSLKEKLRIGGKAVFSVPHETINWRYRTQDWNRHLYTWSPMAIGNLFNEAGFLVDEVRVMKGVSFPGARRVERMFGHRILNLLCKASRILRMILAELGIKGDAADGDCLVVAFRRE